MSTRRTMSLNVRLARPGDEPALATLNAHLHQIHLANRPQHFKQAGREEVTAWFHALIQEFSVRIWIAEERDLAIGYASVFLHEQPATPFVGARRWFEIDQLAVDPAWRRRGVARALTQAILESAIAGGIRDIETTCWAFNQGAQAALRRLGFTSKSLRFALEVS